MFELQECLQCYDNLADNNIESDVPICKDCYQFNNVSNLKNQERQQQLALLPQIYQSKYPEIDEIINGKLYLGNEDASTIREELTKRNITHVLIVGGGMKKCFEKDLVYKQIIIDDSMYANISKYFQECYDFIDSSQTVFVHCAAGVSRSSTIVISYIMKKFNKTYDQAYKQVKQLRYIIRPNVGFIRQLQEYEKTLNLATQPVNEENEKLKEKPE